MMVDVERVLLLCLLARRHRHLQLSDAEKGKYASMSRMLRKSKVWNSCEPLGANLHLVLHRFPLKELHFPVLQPEIRHQ